MENTLKNKTNAEGRKWMLNWVPSPGAMPASSKARIRLTYQLLHLKIRKAQKSSRCCQQKVKDGWHSILCKDNQWNKMSSEFWCLGTAVKNIILTVNYMIWRKPYLTGYLSPKFPPFRKYVTIKDLREFIFTEEPPVPFPTLTLHLFAETWIFTSDVLLNI